jgi:hypothetical protein
MDGSSGVAISPRFSVFLPTGDKYMRGEGVVSWQANLPVSIDLTSNFVMHLNVGMTLVPDRKITDFRSSGDYYHDLTSYSFGGSLVWLMHPQLNFLCEVLRGETEEIFTYAETRRFGETIVNPGARAAINTSVGQFVPGLAFPVRIADGRTDVGIFGYFSFEHSY